MNMFLADVPILGLNGFCLLLHIILFFLVLLLNVFFSSSAEQKRGKSRGTDKKYQPVNINDYP